MQFSFHRCRDSGDTDAYLPCSLALFSVYLQSFQKDYSAAAMVSAQAVFVRSYIIVNFDVKILELTFKYVAFTGILEDLLAEMELRIHNFVFISVKSLLRLCYLRMSTL